jgi:hypothetical protein
MGDIAALVPYRAGPHMNLPFDEWVQMMGLNNLPMRLNTTLRQDQEPIIGDFSGLVMGAYRSNPVVFGLELKRLALFTQARFKYRRFKDGELFGDRGLRILERPELGETTQDLLYRILISADFGGDAFVVHRGDRLVVPRPDWVTLVLGSREEQPEPSDLDIELVAILYHEGGPQSGRKPKIITRREFAHFAPIRDPLARYRGIPWPIAALYEIQGDRAATVHKLQFFNNGATPNLVVTLDPKIQLEAAREWIELFDQEHKGVLNAYKTMYFGGGAQATVVGSNLEQLDFKNTQGAGETRIALASGIHPVVAGLSEGMQGSSLNAGNFHEAKQITGDTFLRPEWANLAGSLEVIVPPPAESELWYDESLVSFLKEDVKAAAEVVQLKATAIRTLTDGGYKPETVIATVWPGAALKHAGYLPVQVQPIQADSAAESDPTRQAAAALGSGVPQLGSGEPVEVRCASTRKDGSPCGALIGKRTATEPVGFEAKCWRCGTLVAA